MKIGLFNETEENFDEEFKTVLKVLKNCFQRLYS